MKNLTRKDQEMIKGLITIILVLVTIACVVYLFTDRRFFDPTDRAPSEVKRKVITLMFSIVISVVGILLLHTRFKR